MANCEICGQKAGVLGLETAHLKTGDIKICMNCSKLLLDVEKYYKKNDVEKNMSVSKELSRLVSTYGTDNAKCGIEIYLKIYSLQERTKVAEEFLEAQKNLITTVSNNIEGYTIRKYIQTISTQTIIGTGFLSEIGAGVADILGTVNTSFDSKFALARGSALNKLDSIAIQLGANAIIGVTFDYEIFSNNSLAIFVSGTAVSIEAK
ncbi:MAG: heavy metal-binding domain-containing protein [Hespellia sp.]|nr:heavy metal-binding domain-containing protein [Hespellia sp.]